MLEHPALAFVAAAVLLPLVPRRLGTALLLAAPVAAFVQLLRIDRARETTLGYFGFELHPLRLDDLSAAFAYVFVIIALLGGIFAARIMSTRERVVVSLYAGAGLAVVLAGDLISFFVAWEVKAVASALLIAFGGRSRSVAAAMRYLVFHVAGGSLLLGGMVWHLSSGGGMAFSLFDAGGPKTLMLVGVLVGAAVPPLHAWLPDAYPEAGIAGTVFLSAFTTKAAVYALARGFAGTEALVVLGVIMALFGVVYAVLENDIRRLLAYHIVSQVGFMVAAVGIGTAEGVNGATAHAFAHILYKGLLLMGAGTVLYATGRSKLSELGGLARAMPAVLGLYLVAAFSISGVPVFSGFVSKELVVHAAYEDGRDVVVQLLKLASVGTFLSTALKLPVLAWGGPDRGIRPRPVPPSMLIAMVVTAAINVVIGLYPRVLYRVLPHPEDFRPFTAAKLSETIQLLLFTALAYWLLRRKLTAEPKLSLDVDWLYRRGPALARPPLLASGVAVSRWRLATTARCRGLVGALGLTRLQSRALAQTSESVPAVTPTPLLGGLALAAFLLVLVVGLLS